MAILLTVNAVINGGWFGAGTPIPFETPEEVPEPLRPFIVSEPEAPEEPEEYRGDYQPNTVYLMNPAGPGGRALREVAQLAGAAAEQEAAEEAAQAAAHLDEETAQILQADHDAAVAFQIKAAEVAQAQRDAPVIAAQRELEEEAAGGKPAVSFYVRRGAVWSLATRARLRPGEPVYVKQPSGQWWTVGVVDANGALPPPEVTI